MSPPIAHATCARLPREAGLRAAAALRSRAGRARCTRGLQVLLLSVLSLLGGTAHAARGDRWLRVSTPELTVLTTLDEKNAIGWASEFTQYIAALRDFFRTERKLSALTIVVFPREREFERYYPLVGPGGKPQVVDGFFSRNQSWSVVGLRARVSEETRRTIFHEGVHWFLSTTDTQNPVWLEEGLAEVFSTFRAEKDRAEWGRAIPDHVELLVTAKPLPLERLLYTAKGDLFGDDTLRTGIVYAQSWAFVHFLIFGKHDIPRRAMADYIEAITAGKHPDEAFRTAFRRTYAEMDRLLSTYLAGGTYFVARRPLAAVAAPQVQPAAPVEIEDALGRLAFAGHRWDLAITRARAAIAAAPADPRGYEVLAIALKAKEDEAGANAAFEAAIERGTKDFQPYFETARASHQRAVRESGELSPADARKIANRYERAINLYPRFRATYENLAGVVGLAEPWGEEDRKFLEFGLRLYPDNAMIRLGLAQLVWRAGNRAEARKHLERVMAARDNLPTDAAQFAHRLDAAWEHEEIGRKVDELAEAGRFADAVAFIDQKLAAGVDTTLRMRLRLVRARLQTAQLSQQVKHALDERRWVDARRLLSELLESEAAPPVKAEARRALSELEKNKLGVE